MKLDKENPTGYDEYVMKRVRCDRKWAKKMKGAKRDAKRKTRI